MKTAKWIIKTIPGAMRLWRRYVQLTLRARSSEDVFTDIYVSNKWGGRESVSGPGSDLRSN
jgi:hypothetical protein